ncbi:MAG: hypothetical protein E5Y34_07305 [Mesorhizobium sp.]|uniref:hypothetical protein n=1 Tax=Mesorhizobium sp. TaxID=1871066 RepID=UPI00121677D0|nr:hypothetical protein [Mesorhizobium sp.]TIN02573.1 MAG: hypothetical protein E5Y34_07305 [Mesorhizobium sp.]
MAELSKALVEEFALEVLRDLHGRSVATQVPPSALLMVQIKKRVPPGAIHNYASVVGAVRLLANEIDTVGSRINRYRYLVQYGDNFKAPSPEIGMAFITHLHDLRPTELYIILERGAEALRFAAIVGAELGYSSASQASAFSNAFKKRLERRLRERHRITHAHERPSMTSLMLELPGPKTEKERSDMGEALGDLLAKLAEGLARLSNKTIEEAYRGMIAGEYRKVHRDAFEEEASFMWQLFTDHITATFAQDTVCDVPTPSSPG